MSPQQIYTLQRCWLARTRFLIDQNCHKISTVMSGFIAFSYNLDMKIKGPSSRCRSDPYTQVGFLPCYGIGNIQTILFSLHQLYKMQRISSFPKESDRLRCFVLVTTPLFTRLRFLQTIRTFAKFKSLLVFASSEWGREKVQNTDILSQNLLMMSFLLSRAWDWWEKR